MSQFIQPPETPHEKNTRLVAERLEREHQIQADTGRMLIGCFKAFVLLMVAIVVISVLLAIFGGRR